MAQKLNLYDQPFVADRKGSPPLTITCTVLHNVDAIVGGVPASAQKNEVYVLLSSLPDELRARVVTAVQMLIAGG